jgi:hypothetical protein
MQEYNYNFEIRTLLSHFMAAFNDVKIKRFDGERFEKESIKVPFTFAPKSHILQDLIGKTDTVRLPIMAAEIKSQGRDNDRVKNKMDDIIYRNEDGNLVNMRGTPWNITIELSILAKFQEDLDQIIQNFAVNASPYVVVSWQEPKSGREIRTEIAWDNQISYTYPGNNQTSKEPPFRVTATTTFTIKGFIFKANIENSKPICMINTDYIFTDKFYCNYETLVEYTSANNSTDSYSITGRPVLRYVAPYYIIESSSPIINLQGYSLNTTNAIFLSASNPDMYPMTLQTPFTALDSFSAFPVPEFDKSDNVLTFTLPAPSADGFLDIIAVNSCGYGKLTEDANRCGRLENPYPVGSPEYTSWCVKQFPYVNGLIIATYFDPWYIKHTDRVYQFIEEN